MQFDIAIGVPSYNEADNIRRVIQKIDEGIQKYYSHLDAVIVNADNHSSDGTRDVFLNTKTVTDKHYLSTLPGVRGKGANFKNFFDLASHAQVKAAAVFDADLESIEAEWIFQMIEPLLNGVDFVYPGYSRYRYDGALTSQLCFPLIMGAFGVYIRQPIGGEFGFSKRYLDILSGAPLPQEAACFGIDIYLTATALIHQMNISGTSLSRKIHRKRDRATLGPMLREVMGAFFMLLCDSNIFSKKIEQCHLPLIFGESFGSIEACPPVPIDFDSIKQQFFLKFPEHLNLYQQAFSKDLMSALMAIYHQENDFSISSDLWVQIVYRLLRIYIFHADQQDQVIASIEPLFFARLIAVINETKEKSDLEVEQYFKNQAELFFMHRSAVLDRNCSWV